MLSSQTNERITAYCDHTCYKCEKSYSSGPNLIKHIKSVHKIQLPSRKPGIKRKVSTKYEFVSAKSKPHKKTFFACPSCWFHCPTCPKRGLKVMTRHIEEHHLDNMGEGYESPLDDTDSDDDEDMPQKKELTEEQKKLLAKLEDLRIEILNQ